MATAAMPPETPNKPPHDLRHPSLSFDHSLQATTLKDANSVSNHSHAVRPLLSYSSLTLPDGHTTSNSLTLLAPPGSYSRERRHSASPSLDFSQNSKRRVRRPSSPRLSELDDKNYMTLLTLVRAVQIVCTRVVTCFRPVVNSLFVSRSRRRARRRFPDHGDIIQQTNWICTDYIAHKLASKKLMSRKVALSAPGWSKSVHVINACCSLELAHPRTYCNVSRKLCMTMGSPRVVRRTLTLLLNVLFEGDITWGKVVSMFAVAGLFGEECAIQGHSGFIKDIVDVVVEVTGTRLVQWLVLQGGWDAFPLPYGHERARLSKLRLLLLTCSALLLFGYLLDFW